MLRKHLVVSKTKQMFNDDKFMILDSSSSIYIYQTKVSELDGIRIAYAFIPSNVTNLTQLASTTVVFGPSSISSNVLVAGEWFVAQV